MEHLAENFLAYFGDRKLVTMFKKLCQQKRRHKFGKIWKELDELTSKYMRRKVVLVGKHSRSQSSMMRQSLRYKDHATYLILWLIRKQVIPMAENER